MLGQHGKGIQTRQRGARVEQHQRVAGCGPVTLVQQHGGLGASEQMAKAAPAEPVGLKAALLDLDQGFEVSQRRGADAVRGGRRGNCDRGAHVPRKAKAQAVCRSRVRPRSAKRGSDASASSISNSAISARGPYSARTSVSGTAKGGPAIASCG